MVIAIMVIGSDVDEGTVIGGDNKSTVDGGDVEGRGNGDTAPTQCGCGCAKKKKKKKKKCESCGSKITM